MKSLIPALLAALLLGAPISADPNPQLVSSIENRLAHYGLSADVAQFATSTVVQLHFALSSRQGYLKTKRELRSILRNAKYK
jgi:hypothetical protein